VQCIVLHAQLDAPHASIWYASIHVGALVPRTAVAGGVFVCLRLKAVEGRAETRVILAPLLQASVHCTSSMPARLLKGDIAVLVQSRRGSSILLVQGMPRWMCYGYC